MPYYQNVGLSTVSYFGVSIEPGQIEKLPKDVMNKDLVKVFFYPQDKVESEQESEPEEPVKPVRRVRRTSSDHKQQAVAPNVSEPNKEESAHSWDYTIKDDTSPTDKQNSNKDRKSRETAYRTDSFFLSIVHRKPNLHSF